jgi:hypothetical protein
MKKIKEMNIGELAAYICSYLNDNGIECVLTGGACVSIYTNNEYPSYDLDFIESVSSPRKVIINLLSKIGFEEKNRYFTHTDTKFIIEFPAGPLSVGSESINQVNEINYDTGKLKLLTPTDCVKDRLAAYFHWNDTQSLEQAISVSKNHKIDIKEIERWSKAESKQSIFKKIKNRLS